MQNIDVAGGASIMTVPVGIIRNGNKESAHVCCEHSQVFGDSKGMHIVDTSLFSPCKPLELSFRPAVIQANIGVG